MSSKDRQARAVAAIAEAVGAEPITRGDLPPDLPGHLRTAVATAADGHHAAVTARDATVWRLATARDHLDELTALVEREQSHTEEAAARLAAGTARAAELRTGLGEVMSERVEVQRALGEWAVHAERARERWTSASGLVAAVRSGPLDDASRRQVAEGLRREAEGADGLGLGDAARQLARWADELESGSAALVPAARALLDRAADLDRRWAEAGAGDPGADVRVLAARQELLASQEAWEQLESQARSGNLGERLRRTIEAAHAARVELEEQGRRVDADQLAAAKAAEAEALGLVGFDSMLDFRVAMSTTGAGALAETRRQACQERIQRATSSLRDEVEASRARHEELRREREDLERTAAASVPGCGPDWEQTVAGLYEVPEGVQSAIDALEALAAGADRTVEELRGRSHAVEAAANERAAALRDLDVECRHAAAAEEAARNEAAAAAARATFAAEQVRQLEAALEEAEAQVARTAGAAASAEQRGYTHADVARRRDALLALVRRRAAEVADPGRATTATAVVVDDPTVDLHAEDALDVVGALVAAELPAPVAFVTSRPELADAGRRAGGAVHVVDARRRRARRWRPGPPPERLPSPEGLRPLEAQHG